MSTETKAPDLRAALQDLVNIVQPDASPVEDFFRKPLEAARAAIAASEPLPEYEETKRGHLIAAVLMLKKKQDNGRYHTAWGDRTALGLYRMLKRIINEGGGP
jgi:hypothetical protein